MPDDKAEIPTPEIAQYFPHLTPVADKIPPSNPDAQILLLLGRDILSVHKVCEQYNGPHNTPYAQRLDLGWVIVGKICLDRIHQPAKVNVYKTIVLSDGRASFFTPCSKGVQLKEKIESQLLHMPTSLPRPRPPHSSNTDHLGDGVFCRNADDEKLAFSTEDNIFLDKGVQLAEDNNRVALLHFRTPRKQLQLDFFEFMHNIIEKQQAEPAPPLKPGEECWYL